MVKRFTPEQLRAIIEAEPDPCKHCGRLVLCGPACCQGMLDDIKAQQDAERAVKKEAKRQRRLARRAARRALDKP